MNKEYIENIRNQRRINPHKLFPDNPAPYSHVWKMTNTINETYIINWDTQTIEHHPSRFPELFECYKITEVSMQKHPLIPGIYVKVDHETVEFELLTTCKEWEVDGKSYIPFYNIEPTPGRELPPLDNPNAEWTGFVTDGSIDLTDKELKSQSEAILKQRQEEFFTRRKREFTGKGLLSREQLDYVAQKQPDYQKIVAMFSDYVDGKIDTIDSTYIPGQEIQKEIQQEDLDEALEYLENLDFDEYL